MNLRIYQVRIKCTLQLPYSLDKHENWHVRSWQNKWFIKWISNHLNLGFRSYADSKLAESNCHVLWKLE